MEDSSREATESWAALLRDLLARGMQAPVLAVGDRALGFCATVRDVGPETERTATGSTNSATCSTSSRSGCSDRPRKRSTRSSESRAADTPRRRPPDSSTPTGQGQSSDWRRCWLTDEAAPPLDLEQPSGAQEASSPAKLWAPEALGTGEHEDEALEYPRERGGQQ